MNKSYTYKQFREHSVEIFNRLDKEFEDMVDYDQRLILFHPYGSLLYKLSTAQEIEEARRILNDFQNQSTLKEDIMKIIGEIV